MSLADLTLIGITLSLALVLFLAIIEVAFHQLTKISIRAHRDEGWKKEYLSRCLAEPMNFILYPFFPTPGSFIWNV